MWRELIFGPLLLVYQMPKTGSQTVEATVQNCGWSGRVVRVHFLSRALAKRIRAGLKGRRGSGNWERHTRQQLADARVFRRVLGVRRFLRSTGFGVPKVLAISAVREPLGLALAAIFENYLHLFNNLETATLAACRRELLRPRDHKFVQRWFELELWAMLRINVYAIPFPQDKGYAIFESRQARALVYRFEALSRLPSMLQEFLGLRVQSLSNRNLGATKDYAAAYERAKANLKLPRDFVRGQCHTRMMRHFYSHAERERLEQHWSEAPDPSSASEKTNLDQVGH